MVWRPGQENEVTYDGEWQDGKAHGYGVMNAKDYAYEGKFMGHKKHGLGVQTWDNFIVKEYRGEWQDDEPKGKGCLIGRGKDKYVGKVDKGQPHGLGELWTRTCHYVGDFEHGIEHGFGTLEIEVMNTDENADTELNDSSYLFFGCPGIMPLL